jgi:GNAT superfamily N-acetyltransferase
MAGATVDVAVRPLSEADLDGADRIMRLAFGTHLGLPDPGAMFGDMSFVHTRFRAAPDCAWAAEVDGELAGSVFATRWGSFGFFGPLTVDPTFWNRGIASALLEPVLAAFARWELRQSGLYTFANSPRHIGLYQKHGFWPRYLTVVLEKQAAGSGAFELVSDGAAPPDELRELTDAVLAGLDLGREITAVVDQGLGDTVVVRDGARIAGMAVCHTGAGSEAGSGACYVKFGAAAPGPGAAGRFEALLQACGSFAASRGLERLVAGISTGRTEAYRSMLRRGFRIALSGISMVSRPEEPDLDTSASFVLDDLR